MTVVGRGITCGPGGVAVGDLLGVVGLRGVVARRGIAIVVSLLPVGPLSAGSTHFRPVLASSQVVRQKFRILTLVLPRMHLAQRLGF